ncbi:MULTISPECIES: TetR/AcrR family transcriptional regulator [Streptomycetaceae]|uniref:Putative tetR family transcriptional regulator n=1 Tax=Streptantibioticus cattleyicolor (strain ATCC 35852 / DSM 46488 / JCM 4925 / NBRC 14057 / NRRL 8057) TaxID=1003195 RepID=F8K4S1_STREN|nr:MULTISPECIES: TetR family transcriptional regulator [Streptomycetaceae]AEW96434.1 putative tetR family transcriptional regulator [Streptantibioticus cattleyicolor NRRL 8057 = DSM 46488]MYS60941.1 TetR family transcriptional regulator [Streptomyces sp. SID5468]CCB76769.1 putative TetR-family transcriptional regulator [Streptantibioticus cattleyicolor NRRL 8057 = DSM 46488]
MPAARELLLQAALTALSTRPWGQVRMVEVAAEAGVSRQTLYNEFGSKDGLARALGRREAETFLGGFERTLAAARRRGADCAECFAAGTAFALRAARRSPLARDALTGCPGARLPAAPELSGLAAALPHRAAGALAPEAAGPPWVCEAAVRLAVSYVAHPAPSDEDACARVARLVRALT